MANEINIVIPDSGLTLVAGIWSAATQIGSNISLTENTSRLGHYYGNSPASIVDGVYMLIVETDLGVVMGANEVRFLSNQLIDHTDPTVVRNDELAQAGTNSSLTLNTNASAIDYEYEDMRIYISSGLGKGQLRTIYRYNGETRVATMFKNWRITPDSTSVYRIII
jgi:azurin